MSTVAIKELRCLTPDEESGEGELTIKLKMEQSQYYVVEFSNETYHYQFRYTVLDSFGGETKPDQNSGQLALYPLDGNAIDNSGNGHH